VVLIMISMILKTTACWYSVNASYLHQPIGISECRWC